MHPLDICVYLLHGVVMHGGNREIYFELVAFVEMSVDCSADGGERQSNTGSVDARQSRPKK